MDDHDVLVLQLEGTKGWDIESPVAYRAATKKTMKHAGLPGGQPTGPRPKKRPRFSSGVYSSSSSSSIDAGHSELENRAEVVEPPLRHAHVVLDPGNCLYIPSGVLHRARNSAVDGSSTHLTFAVEAEVHYTGQGLLHLALVKQGGSWPNTAVPGGSELALHALVHDAGTRNRARLQETPRDRPLSHEWVQAVWSEVREYLERGLASQGPWPTIGDATFEDLAWILPHLPPARRWASMGTPSSRSSPEVVTCLQARALLDIMAAPTLAEVHAQAAFADNRVLLEKGSRDEAVLCHMLCAIRTVVLERGAQGNSFG